LNTLLKRGPKKTKVPKRHKNVNFVAKLYFHLK
jgi:hypothetical protein